jgi:hypothetical protein
VVGAHTSWWGAAKATAARKNGAVAARWLLGLGVFAVRARRLCRVAFGPPARSQNHRGRAAGVALARGRGRGRAGSARPESEDGGGRGARLHGSA